MRVELVSTGDEILFGEVVDTNTAYAAALLADHAFTIGRHHTCGDSLQDLVEVLGLALGQADAVVCCGGLGHTQDDRTREAVARVLGAPLQEDPALLAQLGEKLQALGIPLLEADKRGALLPRGARPIPNPVGTAFGIEARQLARCFETIQPRVMMASAARPREAGPPPARSGCNHGRGIPGDRTRRTPFTESFRYLFCLPGPPIEYRTMFQESVLPRLLLEKSHRGETEATLVRVLRVFGRGESWVENALGNIQDELPGLSVGFQAVVPEVLLKLRVRCPSLEEAQSLLDAGERLARERLGVRIYAAGDQSLAATVLKLLASQGKTLAVAESCTGGLLGKLLTDVPGSSAVFLLSAVTYADRMKQQLLGVPREVLDIHGAVSEACARAMAEGVRRLSGADVGVAVTGIAGPEGGTPEKPVGTVCLALCDDRGTETKQRLFSGHNRDFMRLVSAHVALDLVRRRSIQCVAK